MMKLHVGAQAQRAAEREEEEAVAHLLLMA